MHQSYHKHVPVSGERIALSEMQQAEVRLAKMEFPGGDVQVCSVCGCVLVISPPTSFGQHKMMSGMVTK